MLDLGVSFHATSHRELFENYVSRNLSKVYLCDDQTCDITGKEDVRIQLNGSFWKFNNVRHAPNFRKNLISVIEKLSSG